MDINGLWVETYKMKWTVVDACRSIIIEGINIIDEKQKQVNDNR